MMVLLESLDVDSLYYIGRIILNYIVAYATDSNTFFLFHTKHCICVL